ncbi:N-acetylmuramoyl-L-alanine amidase [Actinomadura sp. DC4]|uniref:N-acetylmuramoyl-L-alanine amidase n=1 Tax=Actinomadura sp. DC4 TaxID=3055069 RepID=UPI0025AFB9D1|nr:N-acetylmuramoyl-L-alanine amidase [Actinomadura sp. DC4]MDN3355955.1 N-acetylmuramoyl-L-alanine amidase [Actinomadura sp. DC4]
MTFSGRKAAGAVAIAAAAGVLSACGSGGGSSASAAPPSPAPTLAGASSTSPSQGSLAGKVIVIDPGHNGGNASHPAIINKKVNVINAMKPCNSTGTATNDDYAEHAFTWDVANRLAKILRAKGAKVILTRKNDKGVGPCVDERAKIANRAHADASLAIHGDGAPASGHGFHIIEPAVIKGHNEKIVPESRKLGLDIRNAFHEGTGIPYSTYLGKKGLDIRSDLGGLNVATVPAVFIEAGNMRNAGDAAKMKSPAGRERMAQALAQGFVKFLT